MTVKEKIKISKKKKVKESSTDGADAPGPPQEQPHAAARVQSAGLSGNPTAAAAHRVLVLRGCVAMCRACRHNAVCACACYIISSNALHCQYNAAAASYYMELLCLCWSRVLEGARGA